MSTRTAHKAMTNYILLTRSFIVIFGCIAVWWGITELPSFWQESLLERTAKHIIAGDPFKSEVLNRQIPVLDNIRNSTYCRPGALRSAAIIQLRMVEVAAKSNREFSDDNFTSLDRMIRSSLSCSPADPFLWLVLSSVENAHHEEKTQVFNYLKLSYEQGPNEAWIALKRNGYAFSFSKNLPSDLSELAIDEFIKLLNNRFYDATIDTFLGPASRMHDLLLPRLTAVSVEQRQIFAHELYQRGYDISVPGIEQSRRHWRP